MSKFNKKVSTKEIETTNLAGGIAYAEKPELKLASLLLTSMVKDQFYRSADGAIADLRTTLDSLSDKKFAAQAAVYARTKFGMRSITHVLAAEIARTIKGTHVDWGTSFFEKVIHRVDDITEILAFYIANNGANLPKSMKKGLAKAFAKFSTYQLAKYRGAGKAISLVDAMRLIHPKPNLKSTVEVELTDYMECFDSNMISVPGLNKETGKVTISAQEALMRDLLRSFDTWETELSEAGSVAGTEQEKEILKADAWENLVKTKKIGYFALLRNLRNIAEQCPAVLDEALVMLTDETLIKKSLVLPFRFYTAYRQFANPVRNGYFYGKNSGYITSDKIDSELARKIVSAITKAVDISLNNVPKFEGRTAVVIDSSGSMGSHDDDNLVNGKAPICVASLFAATLAKANNADIILFDGEARDHAYNPSDPALTICESIIKVFDGGTTDFDKPFEHMTKAYDRVVIFSDMQGWDENYRPTEALKNYKERCKANPKIFSFDLAGYGTLKFPQKNVYALAGFSEKVFDIMTKLEGGDRDALVNEIKKIVL